MTDNTDLVEPTVAVVRAYVGNNYVAATDVPGIIRSIYNGLASLKPTPPVPEVPLIPAVPIKQSITPDYLISLEDGRRYRTLKRHLAVRGMTPAQYRLKWGLPFDYPMTAPNHTRARSELALSMGFGTKGNKGARQKRKSGHLRSL